MVAYNQTKLKYWTIRKDMQYVYATNINLHMYLVEIENSRQLQYGILKNSIAFQIDINWSSSHTIDRSFCNLTNRPASQWMLRNHNVNFFYSNSKHRTIKRIKCLAITYRLWYAAKWNVDHRLHVFNIYRTEHD